MAPTKARILDSAERLFAEKGYAPTSLREVISDAAVNLAAVHYHFHSKEALLEAVVERRCIGLNRDRLEMLARFEREAGGRPLELEKIFEAFLVPAFRMAYEDREGGPQFARLMGRLYAEGDLLPRIVKNNFGPVLETFAAALKRALPGVGEEDLLWRMHFAIGAVAHTLRGGWQLEHLPGGPIASVDWQVTLHRLIDFLTAGFRAPIDALRTTALQTETTHTTNERSWSSERSHTG